MPNLALASNDDAAFIRSDEKPQIRLPIDGRGALMATLTGEAMFDGEVLVTADIRHRKSNIADVFVMRGPLKLDAGPYNLWVGIGNAAFRTQLEQHESVQDFIAEAKLFLTTRAATPARS